MSFYTQIDNRTPIWQSEEEGLCLMPHELYLREFEPSEVSSILEADKSYSGIDSCTLSNCGGFILHLNQGVQVQKVIETTFSLKTNQTRQKIKNLIVIGEEASLSLNVTCQSLDGCENGYHLGFDEIYLKENAKLVIEIDHSWSENIQVRPAGKIVLEKGSTLQANYRCLKPVNDLKFLPLVELIGDGARASFSSQIEVFPQADLKIGQRVKLIGNKTQTESTSKIVSNGGQIENLMLIDAIGDETKGHIDCQGLLLSTQAQIRAIPELIVQNPSAELSHEASIGGLNKAELEYLQARGLTYDQSVSLLARGFLKV